ncbi:MAG: hypothetical protein CMB70_04425 [Euryarchaeota archaeon]|nr:hypothetical protein [Euryarchaeota archaeon]
MGAFLPPMRYYLKTSGEIDGIEKLFAILRLYFFKKIKLKTAGRVVQSVCELAMALAVLLENG